METCINKKNNLRADYEAKVKAAEAAGLACAICTSEETWEALADAADAADLAASLALDTWLKF